MSPPQSIAPNQTPFRFWREDLEPRLGGGIFGGVRRALGNQPCFGVDASRFFNRNDKGQLPLWTPHGRWLIYATRPDPDAFTAGNLTPDFTQFNARFAEVCPGLPDRVVDRLALGPRELEARFGLTGGHIFHGEMLGDQLLERRFAPRAFGAAQGALA